MIKSIDGWKFFYDNFKDGQRVVIITDDDEIFAGRAEFTKLGVSITPTRNKKRFFYWNEVEFISHDGFPVKKLLGADGSSSIEKLDTTQLQEELLGSLSEFEDEKYNIVRGDPFLIEQVTAKIITVQYPETGFETSIKLKAKDGAIGLLYNFETIFYFEKITA